MAGRNVAWSVMAAAGVLALAQVDAADIALTVTNPETTSKTSEPITSGVPFAQGALANAGLARMLSGGAEVPAQFLTTATWPDGSVRWLLCDFQTDLAASGSSSFTLQTGTAAQSVTGVTVDNQASALAVNTGAATFSFDKTQLSVLGSFFTATYGGAGYVATPSSTDAWVVEENGPMKAVVRIDGTWRNGGSPLRDALIKFRARLFFHRNKSDVRLALTFKNNNSFGWDNNLNKQPDLTITGFAFGSTALLPSGGSYVFGSGVEKTFEVTAATGLSPVPRQTRYNGDGTVATGYVADRPLALASPEYYSSTSAWGRITPPIAGLTADRQADFDRFEKLHRAMISTADLENPPNLTGITAFQHLYQDVSTWNDYGDLRWGGDMGQWSGNHYDWVFGMYMHLLRTGTLGFGNIARVMARHEIDFDIYHTTNDGNAYNQQKEWESRPSHNSPDNSFGPGRPTHTWSQGYALHWLLTGDPRGRDAYEEILEGLRLYIWESFNNQGQCNTNEIRLHGWITENLVTLWRINPSTVWHTTDYGDKTIPDTIKAVLTNVFAREAAAGRQGFVYAGDPDNPDTHTRHPLQNCYFIEPAAKAYEEVFDGRDAAYAADLLALVKRMTTYLISITYGGDTNASGYRPLQVPEYINGSDPVEGQIPYLLMAGNAAAFCYLHGSETAYLTYLRSAFQDYSRYYGVAGPDSYVDPTLRSPTCYNSNIYVDTESKIHGWSSRYGQFLFAVERMNSRSYTVTFVAGANGSITGTAVQTVGEGGSCTAVSAVPSLGYRFEGWTGDRTGTENPLTITNVTANMTITANFAANPAGTFTVNFSAGTHGSLSGAVSQNVASGGSCSVVTATAATGYQFVDWTDGSGAAYSTDNPLTVTNVTANMALTANFGVATVMVTLGFGFNLTPSELGADASGHAFSGASFLKAPSSFVSYTDPVSFRTGKSASLKSYFDKAHPATVELEWKAVVPLFNKKAIPKTQTTKEFLAAHPISNLSCAQWVKTQDATGNKGPFSGGDLTLVPPTISLVHAQGSDTPVSAAGVGEVIVIEGTFFSVKAPDVWLEYLNAKGEVKALKLKPLKPYAFADRSGASGKSCMDVTTGDSEITIAMPSAWPHGWDSTLPHNIVIDNKIGRATVDFGTR